MLRGAPRLPASQPAADELPGVVCVAAGAAAVTIWLLTIA
jgi:hypothetical protein